MYEEYFEFSRPPFRLNPDPEFFFGSKGHNKAMAYLHYGVKQGEGFIVITGPVGSGKTMVIRHLIEQLQHSNVLAAQLPTAHIKSGDLLGHILAAYRIEPENKSRAGQMQALEDFLFDQLGHGRRVLLIIDEAQNLPRKTLEELRMLSNLDYEGTPLFQAFLVGQPEFRDTLAADDMKQFMQRTIASFHLEDLGPSEMREYIFHRLTVSGWRRDPEFTDKAMKAIYDETGGRPRLVNLLCHRLLLHCSLEKNHKIDGKSVAKVIADHRLETGEKPKVSVSDNASESVAAPPSAAYTAGSVLDRLRARRDEGASAEEVDSGATEYATMEEVASAIAAASSGVEEAPIQAETTPSSHSEKADPIPSSKRKAILHSVNKSRDDLKDAHSSVQRMRKAYTARRKLHSESRKRASDAIDRADKLLKELAAQAR